MNIRRIKMLTWVVAFSVSGVFAGSDPFVQYLAGVEVLRTARHLTDEQKAAWYKKLCQVTGFTAAQAQVRLAHYDENLEQWKKMQTAMINELQEQNEAKKE